MLMSVELLLAFEGGQIYQRVMQCQGAVKRVLAVPDGEYHLVLSEIGLILVSANMVVKGEDCIVKKSSSFLPWHSKTLKSKIRKTAKVKGKHLLEDVVCKISTMAATLVMGHVCNGWRMWCDKEG